MKKRILDLLDWYFTIFLLAAPILFLALASAAPGLAAIPTADFMRYWMPFFVWFIGSIVGTLLWFWLRPKSIR